MPACAGVVPRRVQEYIESEGGISGLTLLARFGGPPYGYTPNVVKSCVAGLLRAGKLSVQPEGSPPILFIRDVGAREFFEDRPFRRATILPRGKPLVGPQDRARICQFFDKYLRLKLDREDHIIADAVASHFPAEAQRLREVQARLAKLPDSPSRRRSFPHSGRFSSNACGRAVKPSLPWISARRISTSSAMGSSS